MDIEKSIVIYLNKFHSNSIDWISEMISNIKVLFFGWVLFIVISMFSNFQLGLKLFFQLALVFIIHYFFSELIIKFGSKKLHLIRRRPYVRYPDEIKGIGKNFSDSSFPSSHVASVVGGLIVLNSMFPFLWPAFVIFAILLALSRLHNGMHYPSDIVAGVILGIIYGYLTLNLSPFLMNIVNSNNFMNFINFKNFIN